MNTDLAIETLLAVAAGHEEWGAGVQLPATVGGNVLDCYHVTRAARVAGVSISDLNHARDVVLAEGVTIPGVLEVEHKLLYVWDRSDVPCN